MNLNTKTRSSTLCANARTVLDLISLNFQRQPKKPPPTSSFREGNGWRSESRPLGFALRDFGADLRKKLKGEDTHFTLCTRFLFLSPATDSAAPAPKLTTYSH